MTVLTIREATVKDCVRDLLADLRTAEPVRYRGKDVRAVPVDAVRARAWDHHHVGYDATARALAGCVAKGLLVKPKRGWYTLPGETA